MYQFQVYQPKAKKYKTVYSGKESQCIKRKINGRGMAYGQGFSPKTRIIKKVA